jgi:outer membrane receptor protein involved in Fe transport
VTPKLNIQVELRRRETDQGDLELRFDPQEFLSDDRLRIEQGTSRLGLRYSPSSQADIIFSYIRTDREDTDTSIDLDNQIDLFLDDEGYQFETQYLFRADRFNITAGFGGYDTRVNRHRVEMEDEAVVDEMRNKFTRDQENGYIYTNLFFPKNVTWTFGASYTSYAQQTLDVDEFSPKLGFQWDVTEDFRLRFATFEAVKPALVVDQTIEPTQIAGFNQFFDDANGTKAKRYGIGLDFRLTDALYAGVEASRRNIDFPRNIARAASLLPEREEIIRSYLYWTPHLHWALSAEYQWDKFESKEGSSFGRPRKVETTIVPLTIRYFDPSGFFGGFGVTFIDHKFIEKPPSELTDDFVLFDTAVGYRFPKQRGIMSLEVRNLFDEEFNFRDDRFRSVRTRNPRFIPDRAIFAQATFNF